MSGAYDFILYLQAESGHIKATERARQGYHTNRGENPRGKETSPPRYGPHDRKSQSAIAIFTISITVNDKIESEPYIRPLHKAMTTQTWSNFEKLARGEPQDSVWNLVGEWTTPQSQM